MNKRWKTKKLSKRANTGDSNLVKIGVCVVHYFEIVAENDSTLDGIAASPFGSIEAGVLQERLEAVIGKRYEGRLLLCNTRFSKSDPRELTDSDVETFQKEIYNGRSDYAN